MLFVAIVAAAGAAGYAIFRQEEQEHARDDIDLVADASVDARVASAKKKGGKNPSKPKTAKGRGGTTRITGRAAPPPTTARAAAPPPPTRREEAPPPDDPTPPPTVKRPTGGGPKGPTFESALDSNDQKLNIGEKTGPDLTDAQIAAPMRDGSFIGDCGAPDDMGVTVKVAIRNGRAVGVTVVTDPSDIEVAGCIDRHVRGLSWPANPKTDSFVTTY